MKKFRLFLLFVYAGGSALILGVAIILSLMAFSKPYTYSIPRNVPEKRIAIVFGAGIRSDNSLTPMLKDRVDGAIALYAEKRAHKILMTGDNSRTDYDEVTAMKAYATDRGIPEADIALDYAGFSTYESCYRAKEVFGTRAAILVTQAYHLPRAIYTCRKLGIDAVGLALPDFSKYPDVRNRYMAREYAAILKAWIELNITHPKPTFLGDPEPIE
ncbi:MAG: hypothetical protein K0S20_615 [Patescibacteria group bacterium]|jgi:vancomycin permeability regulator SanA|nr:hypothetical protein [Patescibacteria group bacterium]